ncbi:MAG: type I restriction endonuclease subunit R [Bacteroidota bacterium]|nr:type I restriction endonuclease subunit R [Bacteroidota bacterium]
MILSYQNSYTEDKLVQQTMADYFRDKLNWESVYAYNDEILGINGTLGRESEKDIVLVRYLRTALEKLNPELPTEAYDNAIRQILETSVSKSLMQTNKEKYELFKNGVLVTFKNTKGENEKIKLRIFDFNEPENNHFLIVRELWVQGFLYRRRPDIVGFVNGIPLLFVELKNVHKDIRRAYNENLSDYLDTIPHIFHHNAIVVLSNGIGAKVGSFSAKYDFFHEWKRLEEDDKGVVDMETLQKGMFTKKNFMDIFEHFIVFDDSTGKTVKILAKNHQYLGVNRAITNYKLQITNYNLERNELEKEKSSLTEEEYQNRKSQIQNQKSKLGVFWHTQGSGKSYSMVFFSEKVKRNLKGNFTFLILTDREDLETQIYKTYAGCGIVDNDKDKCRAASGDNLTEILGMDKPYVFSMIHKFNKDVGQNNPYNIRKDIIVISDEAHRTQYGKLALNMRNALPNASYIGFTGTPLFKEDEITSRIFGDYVSTYDFQKAVDDNATVPLHYDNRGDKLKITMNDINEKIAQKLEEHEFDADQQAAIERDLGRDYHIYTAPERLKKIAEDFIQHYTKRWESGKAMMICIDKITTVKMYNLIKELWVRRIKELEKILLKTKDEQEAIYLERQINWLKETEMAVVISEEQGEVAAFRKWDLDIIPHRQKIKNGFETSDGRRVDMDIAFKDPDHKFRVVIVCAMWLTGFDVPSLSTLYLDKPMKAHTLMQAIARANRVYEGKNNGLIVDYCGILKSLREAIATFTIPNPDGGDSPVDPVKPEEELLEELEEVIQETKKFLKERNFDLNKIIESKGHDKNAAIDEAKEILNQSEETRKRFEILAREVFRKVRACIDLPRVNNYREEYGAIDIIYKKLQTDKAEADITDILKELQKIVDEAIITAPPDKVSDEDIIFDISKIDFQKLHDEFKKKVKKNTITHSLKEIVERRLQNMIAKNPMRVDFYKKYQEIIADYNLEKDRVMIEKTFAELLKFVAELEYEEKRAIREGLEEDTLALFDLLEKPKKLKKSEREKLKRVAKELLEKLKQDYLNIHGVWEKEATKAKVKTEIYDYLYSNLPSPDFSTEEIKLKVDEVFNFLYLQYGGTLDQLRHGVY